MITSTQDIRGSLAGEGEQARPAMLRPPKRHNASSSLFFDI